MNPAFFKGNLHRHEHRYPFRAGAYNLNNDVAVTPLHIDVRVGPGNHHLRFVRMTQPASECLSRHYQYMVANSQLRQCRVRYRRNHSRLPRNVMCCQTLNANAPYIERTVNGYPYLKYMVVWRRNHLGNNTVFDAATPAPLGRLPRRISCARIAYAQKLLQLHNITFMGTDNNLHKIWYWPVCWTTPNTNRASSNRFEWCSHLCFNKYCREHIELETQLSNRSRQYGVNCCPGHMVAEHNYADNEQCYYVGYSCKHRWGCRNVTPVYVTRRVKRRLPRKPWSQLRFRSGEPQFSVANNGP